MSVFASSIGHVGAEWVDGEVGRWVGGLEVVVEVVVSGVVVSGVVVSGGVYVDIDQEDVASDGAPRLYLKRYSAR